MNKYEKAAELLKVLSNPKRLQILELLRSKELTVNELSSKLGVLKSNTSQHLAIMRFTEIVKAERKGRNVFYQIVDDKVVKLISTIMLK